MTIDAMPMSKAPSLARMVAELSPQFFSFVESITRGLVESGLDEPVARCFVLAYVFELAFVEGALDYGDPMSVYGRPDRIRIVLGVCSEAVVTFPFLRRNEDHLFSATVQSYARWEETGKLGKGDPDSMDIESGP